MEAQICIFKRKKRFWDAIYKGPPRCALRETALESMGAPMELGILARKSISDQAKPQFYRGSPIWPLREPLWNWVFWPESQYLTRQNPNFIGGLPYGHCGSPSGATGGPPPGIAIWSPRLKTGGKMRKREIWVIYPV